MTATTDLISADPLEDSKDLATFGYGQQLRRGIGMYGSFAAGFSFVSILTTVFQLFFFGYSFGGPRFFWTWPIVLAGQLLVALCFAELAARYPISGAIYQWATRLGGRLWGWTAGWLMMVAQVVTLAGAAIALQVVLPSIWSGFQIVSGDPSLTSVSGAANAVVLGVILLVITTTINAIGVRLTTVINSVGVTCELVGVTLLCIALFSHARRGPGILLNTAGIGGTGLGYLASFAISALMAAYVLVGFDSAGELSEETRDPRRTAPRTILRAVIVSGIGGAAMLIATLMAANSVTDGSLGDPARGLPYVLTSRLGDGLGRVFLVDVAIAISVCTLAIHTAATRMVFSMARDHALPLSRALSKVNSRTGTPIRPALLIGVLAAALLLVNVGNAALFTTLASVCIMLLYLAYLMVTTPLLLRRRKGWPADGDRRLFRLGRWAMPVNVLAVVWGLAMAVNLGWPRTEVFDPSGGHWYLRWFAVLFLVAALAVGAVAYATRSGRRVRPATTEPVLAMEGTE